MGNESDCYIAVVNSYSMPLIQYKFKKTTNQSII
jgi:hypothetical protein